MKRKEEEEEEEEKKKEQADLTSLVVGRTASGSGAADVVVLHVNANLNRLCPFGSLDLHRRWGGGQAFFLSPDLTQPGGGEDDERRWDDELSFFLFSRFDPASLSLSLSDVKQMWDARMFLRWKRK